MNWLESMIEELHGLPPGEMTAVEMKLLLVVGGLLSRIETLEMKENERAGAEDYGVSIREYRRSLE